MLWNFELSNPFAKILFMITARENRDPRFGKYRFGVLYFGDSLMAQIDFSFDLQNHFFSHKFF